MCLATTDPGGPKRCSGDCRAEFDAAQSQVLLLEDAEDELLSRLREQSEAPVLDEDVAPVSFGSKEGRIEAMRQEIDTAIANLGSAESWKRYMDFHGQFHQYSLNNQLLVMLQRPDATQVAGFKKWKELGRSPRKGEKAIWIQAPMVRREIDEATGEKRERVIGFKPVPVFDVGQTDGEPLPARPDANVSQVEGEAPPGMVSELTAAVESRGFPVSYEDLGEDGPRGFTDFGGKRVVVNAGAPPAQQAKTLAHELAHIELGHGEKAAQYHSNPGGQRPDMEVEAESTAFIISKAYGLDTRGYSFGYIDSWAQGDSARVKATADNVIRGASKILTSLNR